MVNGLRIRAVVQAKPSYHWFVVFTVCVGAFMAALDASIINVALPVLKSHFATHIHTIEWVSLVYILTLAAVIVPFSRLSDMVGRRWMYGLGFVVFIIGSFLCGVSPNLTFLLGARVIQGVGAAMLQANSVSIITAVTPLRDRGKAIGIQASAQGIGLSLGPAIGGALLTYLGWRWIFYVNVPVGLIGTALGILLLPAEGKRKLRETFDYLGAITFAPMLVAFIYILNDGLHVGFTSPKILVCGAITIVGMMVFAAVERRAHHPLMDLALFRSRVFALGNLSVLLSFAIMYAVMFLTPFYLDNIRHVNAFTAGLYLTLIPIGMTVFTPLSGAIADAFSAKLPMAVGMSFAVAGAVILALCSRQFSTPGFMIGLVLVGAGMGTFTPPNNSQVMGSVSETRLGIAGGVLNAARTVGMGLGVTLAGLTYDVFLRSFGVVADARATHQQMMQSFCGAFLVVAVIAAVVVGLTLLSVPSRGTDSSSHRFEEAR